MSHEADDAEDDDAGEDARTTVHHWHNTGVPVTQTQRGLNGMNDRVNEVNGAVGHCSAL